MAIGKHADASFIRARSATLGVLLPDQVQAAAASAHEVTAFGVVTAVGAVCAMISNPLAGALSDRTTGRFGRRHPWTVGGALTSAAALTLLSQQHGMLGITRCAPVRIPPGAHLPFP